MRIGIVICSSADLPLSFIKKHELNIMPITLKFGDETFKDVRDPTDTKNFYEHYLANRDTHGVTEPFSVEQIRDWFLDELVIKYDRVLVLSLMGTRSPVFQNATKASFAILKGYREARRKAGISGSFSLRVVDARTLFTGEAVIAYEALRLLKKENVSFADLRIKIEELLTYTHGYLVPNDLYYLRNVARKKGDNSLPLVKYALAKSLDIKPIMSANQGETFPFDKARGFDAAIEKLFDHARTQVDKGLRAPIVCMSYAGDPSEFQKRADYKTFVDYLDKRAVNHTMAVMSTTAGVNLGPGSFSLGFASLDNDFLKKK